ncbi:MAG: hypothetical protein ABI550_05805, partial [Ignavibacteriaceae bacterium]
MKLSIIILLFILSGLSNQLKAQGEAAIPFLYLTPSPELNGLGLTGVSYPNDDPFGFYYNPANLGHFSQNQNLSLHVYPNSVDWLGESGLKFNNSAFNIGYNFKDELNGLNFSVGAGFIHSRFDFGSFRPQFQVQPYESYDL